ncbi:hypothetical protein DAPPUDRAFT_232882 [Daphnia pulex]|uniref:Uncharacterized protein n=1 Tax=Daphnia pulex TaxID=6669 RepID=E9FSL4_DAPPU|nr:hypothetical protein DAPPUDRAFT_232882 [Daphnia pulex]|eukprot:EFX89806.1 hypothetical protein DAPPUDRAFT_232882 [Daphnia pulex]
MGPTAVNVVSHNSPLYGRKKINQQARGACYCFGYWQCTTPARLYYRHGQQIIPRCGFQKGKDPTALRLTGNNIVTLPQLFDDALNLISGEMSRNYRNPFVSTLLIEFLMRDNHQQLPTVSPFAFFNSSPTGEIVMAFRETLEKLGRSKELLTAVASKSFENPIYPSVLTTTVQQVQGA